MLTMSFAFQWFVCLMTNCNLDRRIRRVVLDYFMVEGVVAIFKGALCYFDQLVKNIDKVRSFGSFAII